MQGNVVSPRGIKTMELRPGILRLTKPQDALPTRIGRTNLSAAVAAAESLQLVAGRSHPQLLFQIAPSFRNYTNDVGEFDGAYGPRLDWQMPIVIDRLRRDEYTRQAIAIVYDHDDIRREESKDYPCTLSLHFLIRDGKVCLHTTMRSNDIWLGLPYDMFQFTQLQCSVANGLGRPVGDYTHMANSFHLYERNFKEAGKVGSKDRYEDEPFHSANLCGIGRMGMDWEEVVWRAGELLDGEPLKDPTMTEKWYAHQLDEAHCELRAGD